MNNLRTFKHLVLVFLLVNVELYVPTVSNDQLVGGGGRKYSLPALIPDPYFYTDIKDYPGSK